MNTPLIQFMIDDLAKSGISYKWAVKHGLRPVNANELASMLGFSPKNINGNQCEGYVIPFFDPITKKPMFCPDGHRDYVRVKLRVPAIDKDGDPAKYLSPKDAGQHALILPEVHAYLQDSQKPVIITEGEKKALAATLAELPTIALTGNHGWNIGKTNELLPELSRYIDHKLWIAVYDSDAKINPDFHRSLARMAFALSKFDCQLYAVYLPSMGNGKVGIDDYLVEHGKTIDDLTRYINETKTLVSTEDIPISTKPSNHKSKRSPNQAELLVRLTKEITLFHGLEDCTKTYASISIDNHFETWPLNNQCFYNWLSKQYYKTYKKIPGSQAINDAVKTVQGIAQFDKEAIHVGIRFTFYQESIWLDLCDPEWRIVKISSNDWKIVSAKDAPVKFIRRRGMLPLPQPQSGGNFDDLRQLLHIEDDQNWYLILGWLTGALHPTGGYPMLVVNGEQGSGKSTLCKFLRYLIDANTAALRRPPKEPKDLFIAVKNSYLIAYDNLSSVPDWLSDSLCTISTGGGFATRELYSDDEEIIINAVRPIIINGIPNLGTRSDLVDRSVCLQMKEIHNQQRKSDLYLENEFSRLAPSLIGKLCETASHGLRKYRQIELSETPRMADYAQWIVACAPALEFHENTLLNAYLSNRQEINLDTLEHSPLAKIIERYLESDHRWQGTCGELLKAFQKLCNDDTSVSSSDLPKTSRKLSNDLKRIAPNLRMNGIEVQFGNKTNKGRTITLEKVGKTPSHPSPSSQNNHKILNTNNIDSHTTSDHCVTFTQKSDDTDSLSNNPVSIEERNMIISDGGKDSKVTIATSCKQTSSESTDHSSDDSDDCHPISSKSISENEYDPNVTTWLY